MRTVSDTKRAFYGAYTRPINSVYRRVVEELMVEMHLLSVNVNFSDSPIYELGVVTSFDRFMQGYRPEPEVPAIFNALCNAVGAKADKYRQQAEQVRSELASASWSDLTQATLSGSVGEALQAVSQNPKFQYSRLFAIGLYTLLEAVDPSAVKDAGKRTDALTTLADMLHLSVDRIAKDLEVYCSNLEKMTQAQQAIADTIAAERKRREQREQEKVRSSAQSESSPGEADSNT